MRKILLCLFILYVAFLVEVLYVCRTAELSFSAKEYFLAFANVCPFRTVFRYIFYFITRRDLFSFRLALFNIGGNFVLFLPMGLLLPVFFPKLRNPRTCFFAIFRMVLLAELFQGVFRVGIPDIDDLAVNMAGACVGILLGKKLERSLS